MTVVCITLAVGAGGGCATATVAAAGTAVGLAASAISTGADVYRLGKLDAADEVRYDHWLAACRASVGKGGLSYHVEKEADDGDGHWTCVMRDDREKRVILSVERRTATVCQTRVDIGLLGSEPSARLILATIRRNYANTHPPPTTVPAVPFAPAPDEMPSAQGAK